MPEFLLGAVVGAIVMAALILAVLPKLLDGMGWPRH